MRSSSILIRLAIPAVLITGCTAPKRSPAVPTEVIVLDPMRVDTVGSRCETGDSMPIAPRPGARSVPMPRARARGNESTPIPNLCGVAISVSSSEGRPRKITPVPPPQ